MRTVASPCVALAACSFAAQPVGGSDDAPRVDAPVDAPPPSPGVRFVSVTSARPELRPGLYGLAAVNTASNLAPGDPMLVDAAARAFSRPRS